MLIKSKFLLKNKRVYKVNDKTKVKKENFKTGNDDHLI